MHEKKKGIFYRTESVAMTPKSRDHMPTARHSGESLQNGQFELRRRNWYFARETHKDTAVSVWACQAGFWKSTGTSCQLRSANPMRYSMGFAKSHLLKCSLHKWACCGAARKSARLNCINLIHFRLSHCESIARELVHCYTWGRLRIVTVRGNTVGRHSQLFCRPHSYTVYWSRNVRWQPHWLHRLTSLLGKPTENKIASFRWSFCILSLGNLGLYIFTYRLPPKRKDFPRMPLGTQRHNQSPLVGPNGLHWIQPETDERTTTTTSMTLSEETTGLRWETPAREETVTSEEPQALRSRRWWVDA